jgi:lysophospholipase
LPNAETLWFGPECAHEMLREIDPLRDRALAGIDRFLEGLPKP